VRRSGHRRGQWEPVPGGERLADSGPWVVERLFLPVARCPHPGRRRHRAWPRRVASRTGSLPRPRPPAGCDAAVAGRVAPG